jgi:hypothetical protein
MNINKKNNIHKLYTILTLEKKANYYTFLCV